MQKLAAAVLVLSSLPWLKRVSHVAIVTLLSARTEYSYHVKLFIFVVVWVVLHGHACRPLLDTCKCHASTKY